MEQLIVARCNVDLQTKNGDTPLHAAALNGHAHLNGHETVTRQLIAAAATSVSTRQHTAAYGSIR